MAFAMNTRPQEQEYKKPKKSVFIIKLRDIEECLRN